MARAKKHVDEPNSVPTWIVSFSDMITLLLAFFVLLQSFAHVQDPELFFVGQGSFKQAIAGMGLPSWMLGREEKTKRDSMQSRHPMEDSPSQEPRARTIDADNEKIQGMFADLQKEVETTATDVSRRALRVEATPIAFAGTGAGLDDAAGAYLRQFASDLKQSVRAQAVRVYVIGLAGDVSGDASRWYESARRAGLVQRYLAERLAGGTAGDVLSWGAGAGGPWCRDHGLILKKTSIVIAIMEEKTSDG
ncbi:MAG TPA: flagellar motor protein MotB [Phycisphaerae bacterium]|nr:flagellar motor protein MotB [Phycisphaerae bacterium]